MVQKGAEKMSKEKILANIRAAGVEEVGMPTPLKEVTVYEQPLMKFKEMAVAGGSAVFEVSSIAEIKQQLTDHYLTTLKQRWHINKPLRILSTLSAFEGLAEIDFSAETNPHSLQDVDIAILKATLGVAENSAMWVPEQTVRALPFICEHLMLVLEGHTLVHNMHEAYAKMGRGDSTLR